ncbi:MAG: hypothetical protein R6U55_17145 [Desulfovermiculus sp.]
MRKRLLEAKGGLVARPGKRSRMHLVFSDLAFEDLAWFVPTDPKLAKKIVALLE